MKGSSLEREASVSEETKDDSLVKPSLNPIISKSYSQSAVRANSQVLYHD
jgi:hypothetical protein